MTAKKSFETLKTNTLLEKKIHAKASNISNTATEIMVVYTILTEVF